MKLIKADGLAAGSGLQLHPCEGSKDFEALSWFSGYVAKIPKSLIEFTSLADDLASRVNGEAVGPAQGDHVRVAVIPSIDSHALHPTPVCNQKATYCEISGLRAPGQAALT